MTEFEETDEPWLLVDPHRMVDRRLPPALTEADQWSAVVEWFNMNQDEIEAEGYTVKQFVPAWQSPTEQAIAFTRELNRLTGWLRWMSPDSHAARSALRGEPAPMSLDGFCAKVWNLDISSGEDGSSHG